MKKEDIKGYKKVDMQWVKIINSKIHGKGLIAKKDIPNETKIIEYVGELITKKESDKRALEILEHSKNDPSKGAVYTFILDSKYDIDGNVTWNPARLINHACETNCDAISIDEGIWICATRDIKKGEELHYNYGYNLDHYKEHPCRCGTEKCVGYIAEEVLWPKLKRKLAKEKKLKLHTNS